MSWVKTVLFNLLLFCALILISELVFRGLISINSCRVAECNFQALTQPRVRNFPMADGDLLTSLRFDEELGFVPFEGFDATIDSTYWQHNSVTITEEGFRANDSNSEYGASEVLVVGDSFTFGDQVANHETWPACLERKLETGVDNGGVTGYGAAQALKRAKMLLDRKDYSSVVLAVVVGDDFSRDQMHYVWGRPRPAVVTTDNGLAWSEVADPSKPGTMFNPGDPNTILVFLYEWSLMFATAIDKSAPELIFRWAAYKEIHPNAAEVEAIIQWTLTEFSRLNVPQRVLLLQYWHDIDREAMLAERDVILMLASSLPIEVVDTFDVLRESDPEIMWRGHHTLLGNSVVCNYLFSKAFSSIAPKPRVLP